MQYQSVQSTNITAIGYDADAKKLGVKFSSGKKWHYSDVPQSRFDDLMAADSKGSYFAREIKGKYPGEAQEDDA
jgi:hypothetical protein